MTFGGVGSMTRDEQEIASQLREDRYARAFKEAMKGEGDFWTARYDMEQEIAAFRLLMLAYKLPGATPATRWGVVESGMRALIDTYAQDISL